MDALTLCRFSHTKLGVHFPWFGRRGFQQRSSLRCPPGVDRLWWWWRGRMQRWWSWLLPLEGLVIRTWLFWLKLEWMDAGVIGKKVFLFFVNLLWLYPGLCHFIIYWLQRTIWYHINHPPHSSFITGIAGRFIGIGNGVEYFVGWRKGTSQVCLTPPRDTRIASHLYAQHLFIVSWRRKHFWNGKNGIHSHFPPTRS